MYCLQEKRMTVVVIVSVLLMFSAISVSGQQARRISATAMGTSTQLGRVISVDISVNAYSTADDQKALLEAFGTNGQEGLSNALHKMAAKGRIAITGTLGYDINYVREFKMPDGSIMIRFATDRPVRFGEAWGQSRSMDYDVTMGEITISKDKKKSTGVLLPAAKIRLTKEGDPEIETYQNPWNLANIKVWK